MFPLWKEVEGTIFPLYYSRNFFLVLGLGPLFKNFSELWSSEEVWGPRYTFCPCFEVGVPVDGIFRGSVCLVRFVERIGNGTRRKGEKEE